MYSKAKSNLHSPGPALAEELNKYYRIDSSMKKAIERRRGGPLQPHSAELRERGYRLYEKGKSNPEIAAELNVPVSTLARWSSKGKWKLRKQFASIEEPLTDSVEDVSQLTFDEKQRRYEEMMADHALRVAYTVKALPSQGLIVNADKIAKLDSIARKALNLEQSKPRMIINVGLLARPVPSRLVEATVIPALERAAPVQAPNGKQSDQPMQHGTHGLYSPSRLPNNISTPTVQATAQQ